MANDPAIMSSMNPATYDYERKRPAFLVTTLSGLILCVLYPSSLQAAAGARHKTDAELTQGLIGTWELPRKRIGISKRFLTYNADGTSKAIRITNDRGFPRRAENEGTWRVNHGYLIREVAKTTHDVDTPFKVRAQIESIENGTVKLRYEDGHKDEMRRISHLPSLPPLLTSETWVPKLSAAESAAQSAEFKKAMISAPQPEYPISARQYRIQGSGMFRLNLAKDGKVDSLRVLKSTGNKTLDDAAEKALRQWRFKPGMMQTLNVPINFVLSNYH
jgi:TonB family protein